MHMYHLLFIHPSMHWWVASSFWLLWKTLLWWSSLVTKWVKDVVLSLQQLGLLLWHGFNPWPWNVHMPGKQEEKKERRKGGREGKKGGREEDAAMDMEVHLLKPLLSVLLGTYQKRNVWVT